MGYEEEVNLEKDRILKEESIHLMQTKAVIRHNIVRYKKKMEETAELTRETYSEYRETNRALYGDIMVSQHVRNVYEDLLCRNERALEKPYFARIDFLEQDEEYCAYVGKKGIQKEGNEIEVVDWRAPAAAIYYENEMGIGTYEAGTEGQEIAVNLKLKRTFDIDKGDLQGFYDSNAASHDELLIKYLSKNKVAGLDDIISTIQREQSLIIRAKPFHNMIVQGVAGSGKTTVIVHRISHLLYNYSKYFAPSEFCIVGGSDILLGYIASGLPELDVYHVKCKRMDELLIHLLEEEWKPGYQVIPSPSKCAERSKTLFALELEGFLKKRKRRYIPQDTIEDDQLGLLLSKENISNLLQIDKISYNRTLDLLEERLKDRLKTELHRFSSEHIRTEKKKKYKQYFEKYKIRSGISRIYIEFLEAYEKVYHVNMQGIIQQIKEGKFDLYDLNAMLLIYFYTKRKQKNEEFRQVFIDEGQEYGPAVYYVLKKALENCYFMVVGDVCQNLNAGMGLDSWEDIKIKVFSDEKDELRVLNKSYRNTIEISEFASQFLKQDKSSYQMEAVVRHGQSVQVVDAISNEETAGVIQDILLELENYHTVGILCFDEIQMEFVRKRLSDTFDMKSFHNGSQNGISVLTIPMSKGLEFDAVIIFRHGMRLSQQLLSRWMYVAATRALHELYVIE